MYWQNRLAGVSSLLRESGRIMRFFQIKRFLPGHPVWAGCILLPLFLILLWAGFVFYSRLQLEAAVRRQEQQGIACSAPGLQKRVGSPDSAAFDLLMGSVRRIVEAAPEETQQWFQDLEPEELARFLAAHRSDIEQADRIQEQHPEAGYAYRVVSGKIMEIDSPYECFIQNYMLFRSQHFRYLAGTGDITAAIRVFDTGSVLWERISREPFFTSRILGNALLQIHLGGLMDAAREGTIGKFDSATLQRWADSMPPQEAKWRERFSLALESEQSMIADYALNWPRTCVLLGFGSDIPEWLISVLKPLYLPHVYSEAREFIDRNMRLRQLCRAECLEDIRAELVEMSRGHDDTIAYPFEPFRQDAEFLIIRRMGRSCAFMRTIRAGLAVELYLRKYGKLPEGLAALVPEFLPEVPKSPFTGEPLRFERGVLPYWNMESEAVETFEGYRVYGGGDPEVAEVGDTRSDKDGHIPVWNRRMTGEGK